MTWMVYAGSNNNNDLKGAMFEMCCNLHGLKYLQEYYKYREEGEWFLEEFWRIFEAKRFAVSRLQPFDSIRGVGAC